MLLNFLFEGLDLTDLDLKVLKFTASGDFKDGNHFTSSYDAKVTHIKVVKAGKADKVEKADNN